MTVRDTGSEKRVYGVNDMRRTQGKVRVTVSLPAAVARQLDDQRRGLDLNRSEAVEEAVTGWVHRRIEADQDRATGLSGRLEEQRIALERQVRLSAQEVLEALKYQFSALAVFSDEELERRAEAALRRRERGR